MANKNTVLKVAKAFIRSLEEDLTSAQFAEINKRNRSKKYKKGKLCASYDFCDANVSMITAMQRCGVKTPTCFVPQSKDWNDAMDIWNAAWSMAKEAEFDVERLLDMAKNSKEEQPKADSDSEILAIMEDRLTSVLSKAELLQSPLVKVAARPILREVSEMLSKLAAIRLAIVEENRNTPLAEFNTVYGSEVKGTNNIER